MMFTLGHRPLSFSRFAWKEVPLPLEHAGAPGLLQPLLERAAVHGFLCAALAISGAVNVAVKQELAEIRQTELVVLHRGLRNAVDVHRERLWGRRCCRSSMRRLC